ncbi:coiled coil protein [Cryptosporidium felis]|nr:coiled coil protein [Cryptosporidium felis]
MIGFGSEKRFQMIHTSALFAFLFFLLLLFGENECNSGKLDFYKVVQVAKEQNVRGRKPTKFDNIVVGNMKKNIEVSTEPPKDKGMPQTQQTEQKNFNLKNSTFVKLWMSDIEIRSGESSGFVETPGSNEKTTPVDDAKESMEIDKFIEENKLLDKLNLLRQQEVEVSSSGETSQFDDLTKKIILASGIHVVSQKSPERKRESKIEETHRTVHSEGASEGSNSSLELDDDIVVITPSQQIVALEILSGKMTIQKIKLIVSESDIVPDSNNLMEPSIGTGYEGKNFLECIEMKNDLIQKIGKLKLENANMNIQAQKLKNRGMSREYRNILDRVEKNKELLQNQNIELHKIEKRIKQLSIEDNIECNSAAEQSLSDSQKELQVDDSLNQEVAIQKKERRKVIIAAILEEAKRRRKLEETRGKKPDQSVEGVKDQAEPEKAEHDVKKSSEEATPREKELSESETKDIEKVAKMLVWLQENNSKSPKSVKTRRERGKSAVNKLKGLYKENIERYLSLSKKIEAEFEKKVYEKNASKSDSEKYSKENNVTPEGKL